MEDEDLIFNISDLEFEEKDLNFIKNNEEEINTAADNAPTDVIEEDNSVTNDDGDVVNNTETDNKETTEDTPSFEADSSQSTLYALAKYLKDEGVLFIEDELKQVETLDELKDLVRSSNERARYNNLNDSQRRYHESLENGIPLNEFENIEKDIATFKNIREEDFQENDQLKFEVIALDFINQGIAKDRAVKLAQISLKDEDSYLTAKESLANILEFKNQEFKALVENSKKTTKIELDSIKEYIDKKDNLLDIKMNDITKNKLFDLMTTKVDTDEKGIPMNKMQKWQRDNPLESNVLLNYLYLMTNEGKDLGLIKTNSTSVASKELERKLKEMNFDSNGSLNIPEHMFRNSKENKNSQNQNLKINI